MKPRIILADDHQLLTDTLASSLNNEFNILKKIPNGHEVIPAVSALMPDLLLLDINLPGKNGLEIAKELKQNFPGLKIIFLTMYNEQKFIQEAMQLNVNGYLLKDSTSTEFIDGIKTVLRNPSSFFKDPKLPKVDYNLHHEDYFVKRFLLSSREIQIIRLIREGKRSSEIAEELFLSHETVKSHRKNIHYKLGIRKAAELIQFASKHGI